MKDDTEFSVFRFSIESPIKLKAKLFIPFTHIETDGISKEKPGVDLYSRGVLIKENCRELLPYYLRFIKGFVDCEDFPATFD